MTRGRERWKTAAANEDGGTYMRKELQSRLRKCVSVHMHTSKSKSCRKVLNEGRCMQSAVMCMQ